MITRCAASSVLAVLLATGCSSDARPSASPTPTNGAPAPASDPAPAAAAPSDDWGVIASAGLGREPVVLRPLASLGISAALPGDAAVTDYSSEMGHPVVLVTHPEVGADPTGSLAVYRAGPGSDLRDTLDETKARTIEGYTSTGSTADFLGWTGETRTGDGWVLAWESRNRDATESHHHVLVRRTIGGAPLDCVYSSRAPSTVPGGQRVCESLRP